MSKASQFVQTGKKIICVLRNYAQHAKEMKSVIPTSPQFFLKPTTSYLPNNGTIRIPKGLKEIHHEVELGVVIGRKGSNISKENAMDFVAGYCLALDMTARSLQQEAKEKGMPWTVSKGFDTFCPVSDFIPAEKIKDPHDLEIWLKVNDVTKQKDSTKNMIFNIPQIISEVSKVMTLEEADVILTGTPAGVGPVVDKDVITAGITGVVSIKVDVKSSD